MIMKNDYLPSPSSEELDLTPPKTTRSITIMDNETGIPMLDTNSLTTVQRARRNRLPPRNTNGQYYCRHPHCQGKDQTFKRVCEWNKHMDRHERPYKCLEIGCELNQGFTYSGGLLRHQREVHKMHLSTKQPLYCPFPNCNRSSGVGFTRRENLEEHKRRRHVDEQTEEEDQAAAPAAAPSRPIQPAAPARRPTEPSTSQEPPPPKRMRTLTPAPRPPPEVKHQVQSIAEVAQTLRECGMTEHQLIQVQQARMLEKDDTIKRQAAELRRLQQFISALPESAIFMAASASQTQLAQQRRQQQQLLLPGGGGGNGNGG